jgi:hypothetical protein
MVPILDIAAAQQAMDVALGEHHRVNGFFDDHLTLFIVGWFAVRHWRHFFGRKGILH